MGHFCPPRSGSGLLIRIRIQGPHWIRIQIHNTALTYLHMYFYHFMANFNGTAGSGSAIRIAHRNATGLDPELFRIQTLDDPQNYQIPYQNSKLLLNGRPILEKNINTVSYGWGGWCLLTTRMSFITYIVTFPPQSFPPILQLYQLAHTYRAR